ncbi:MAG: hypothetical protein U5L98_15990 [Halomonas sp.]|uniref:hypothetical protein n=1 Tax=Halomonas sp. TaxID=1486246 RepID=UPI002ACE634A|nr:hypothetical protein [Halomonas sp.]MDZ7854091.1 hypothetical protein [Halomonas sp.]
METAKIVEPISGDKLYQTRAREVLPILVRQAEAGSPIYYSDLAREAGIPNPRNLNYVLGSIGSTLENLSKAWNEKVPPIQCLVVEQGVRVFLERVLAGFSVKKEDFTSLSRRQQRALVEAELQHIFSFNHWGEVLSELGLEPVKRDYSYQLAEASGFGGKGESEAHKKFKGVVCPKSRSCRQSKF